MSEFDDMLKRARINNLIGFLLYGTEDTEVENMGTYQERIENAYDSLFDSLENMFPNADRRDSDLLGAIMDFSTTYSEVYFEMGILVGMQIYKNLDQPQGIDLMNIFPQNCAP